MQRLLIGFYQCIPGLPVNDSCNRKTVTALKLTDGGLGLGVIDAVGNQPVDVAGVLRNGAQHLLQAADGLVVIGAGCVHLLTS